MPRRERTPGAILRREKCSAGVQRRRWTLRTTVLSKQVSLRLLDFESSKGHGAPDSPSTLLFSIQSIQAYKYKASRPQAKDSICRSNKSARRLAVAAWGGSRRRGTGLYWQR